MRFMLQFSKHILPVLAATMLVLAGCQKADEIDTVSDIPSDEKLTEKYDAAVAQKWMDLLMKVIKSEGKNPPQASRIYSYMGVALYESVVTGMPENKSMKKQLNGLTYIPERSKNKSYDYPTVANETMWMMMKHLLPTMNSTNLAKVDSLHNAIAAERLAETNNIKFGNSTGFGGSIAGALQTWVNSDNFAQTRSMVYLVPSHASNPAYWAPTGPVTSPLEPYWGQIRTSCMANGGSCFVASQIPFSTNPSSSFYQQAYEVYNTGINLSTTQRDIAKWWADDAGSTPTPPGHWMRITHQMVKNMDMSLDDAAEIYLLVGLSASEAFISCWDSKYKVNLVRPYTYIRENIDPNWNTLLSTPPFPEYTSGHSVCSGAAASILTHYLGTVAFTDSSNTFLGLAPRSFSSFNDAAEEAAFSRLYGGIHYREAIVNGVQQGQLVAQAVLNRVKLEKH